MIDAVRRRFPPAWPRSWPEDDGAWLDVLPWRDRAAAEESARLIDTVPEARVWLRHIARFGGVRHAEVLDTWVAPDLAAATGR